MGARAADPEVGPSADVREAGVYDAYGLYVTRYPTSPHRSPLVSNNHRVPPEGPFGSGESGFLHASSIGPSPPQRRCHDGHDTSHQQRRTPNAGRT